MKILVIDGQGGGLGRQLVENIKKYFPDDELIAVGTNTIATQAMIKAGADHAATGENAVCVCSKKVDVIVGPVGMVIADSLLGEITAKMSVAIGQSNAARVLLPMNQCDNLVAGVENLSTAELIKSAIEQIRRLKK